MIEVMKSRFDSAETLSNGIFVHRQVVFSGLEYGNEEERPWIASIRIGPWYYCQGGTTKQDSIDNLFVYMRKQKEQFEDYLKRDVERLETLNKFLATIV